MILIFGGTTEGRAAVEVVEQSGAGKGRSGSYLYSTLTAAQEVATPGGVRLTGGLTAPQATELCRRERVRLIVDAAHPFAEGVHRTVAETANACGIPVIRYERRAEEAPGVIWCDDYDDAVAKLEAAGVERLLALTGVRTIPKLRSFWQRHGCCFRVLDRPESVAAAVAAGFPCENLLFFRGGESEQELLRREKPDAVLTKESGTAGYFPEKAAAARALGIPLYAVRRPTMPEGFIVVYSGAELRQCIGELLPGYFPLRSGYTTGTCATVAACAAVRGLRGCFEFANLGLFVPIPVLFSPCSLAVGTPTPPSPREKSLRLEPKIPSVAKFKQPLSGAMVAEVTVALPGGERVTMLVEKMVLISAVCAEATVVKDAGDDPDVTDGCRITARVELNESGEMRFLQGEGVGRVTLPGLGVEVGEPAVNPAPRKMIRENLAALGITGADVTISVENGAALAEKTLNPKLGIVGGISIIGTSGIVRPFSNEAFVEAIRRETEVAWAIGCRRIVINSGAKSERAVRGKFPGLLPQAFVHYGNFIGEALSAAYDTGFRDVAMGIMIGKAVKLAAGNLDTHSRSTALDREFLANLALGAGCSPAARRTIEGMILARELWTGLSGGDRALFMPALLRACHAQCAPLLPEGRVAMLLISEDGEINYTYTDT